jgi:hypothetical protein
MRTKLLSALLLFVGVCTSFIVNSQSYTENFDNVAGLSGWFIQNNSVPLGPNAWYQGIHTSATPDPGPFNAYNGADNAYAAANFASTTGGSGTISNWLVTPNRTLRNGDVFTFYTRKPTILAGQTDFPDRLEVRLSTNGASTNVGTGATGVGDFTTLLLSINPSLTTNVYPQVWTQYTITISGLPAPTSGRIAFRYFVTSAGPSGVNSDYIGLDNVVYTPYVCPAFTMTPGGALAGGSAGSAYSTSLTQTGALGTPSYAITAGALPPGITLSASGTISGTPTATGTFNFSVTVSDASGCSGTQSYSITIVCGPNPTSLSGLPSLCSNNTPYTLTQGSPAGGTYSGTGVSGGQFDPTAGTQTITYDYTDPYGCPYSSNATITVNTPPTVTLDPLDAVCENAGAITLTGGSPAGGTYSGTGVTGGDFDPTAGTQAITYSYTDVNGCTNEATETITVNTIPVVTLDPLAAVCENEGMITLTGESPAGGTYSGTGVTAEEFDPTAGTQAITYSYTDANGCTNEATETITVNTIPVVTLDPLAAVCENEGMITLTGESPAGGTYSGTGVTAEEFDPTAGTQAITYSYTDANGCTNEATETITVNTIPVVTLDPLAAVCEDEGMVTLTGESPAGGTYSGTGVTAGEFDPTVGTQAITYSYTDANGCTNEATQTITVNALPVVTLDPLDAVCEDEGMITLTGGSPASGTYSGTGVTAEEFDPAAGTQAITYSYTDANGCTNEATQTITVNPTPTVTLTGLPSSLCVNHNSITLNQGLPAGGTYSGTGVTGGTFNPTAAGTGTHVISYTVTQSGCEGSAQSSIIVDGCLGIETEDATVVSVFPNPATSELNVIFENTSASDASIVLETTDGKLVYQTVAKGMTTFNEKIYISDLPTGIYFIRIESASASFIQRVIFN